MAFLACVVAAAARPAAGADATLSPARVRVYAKPSREVYDAVLRLVGDLHLAVDKDDAHQSIVSWWQPVTRAAGEPPRIWPRRDDRVTPDAEELELHVFVSPFVEPARVFVDAVLIKGRRRHAPTVEVRYGDDDITGWFFARLEGILDLKGRALPSTLEQRRLLGQQAAGSGPCNADGSGAVQPPKRFSAPKPIFPAEDLEKKHKAVIEVEGLLGEDGAIHAVRAPQSNEDERMISAALNAVKLWRYEPARAGACPVPARMNVSVDFKPRD